jgi:hypothetical protein
MRPPVLSVVSALLPQHIGYAALGKILMADVMQAAKCLLLPCLMHTNGPCVLPGAAADTVMSEAGTSEAAQPASTSQPAAAGSAAEAGAGAAAAASGEAEASDSQALLEAYLKRLLTLYYHFANAALLFQSPQVCVLQVDTHGWLPCIAHAAATLNACHGTV